MLSVRTCGLHSAERCKTCQGMEPLSTLALTRPLWAEWSRVLGWKVAILLALKYALFEDLHACYSVTFCMACIAQHCWWPYLSRELLVRSIKSKPCTAIGRNFKRIIPTKQFQSNKICINPNQEKQLDLVGPIKDEEEKEIYIPTCMIDFPETYCNKFLW